MVKEKKLKPVPFGGGYEKATKESKIMFNLLPTSKSGDMIKKDICKTIPSLGQ